ncbi:M1 family metallopeptidase [candidate division KSB1 bacterium]|nr:M1 family metallopeptidase [candidate division KSB1 bacterium]
MSRILILGVIILGLNTHLVFAWQQAVAYQIAVTLDDRAHRLTGHEKLVYTNNSPDSLRKLYFHLYQNAYRPGSYLDLKNQTEGNYDLTRLKPDAEGYCQVTRLTDDQARPLPMQTDNTILTVALPEPLAPGGELTLNLDFITQIGTKPFRMRARDGMFVISQWYPKICVYDDHGGWHADQHFGNEFYGNFGSFDVQITLAADFIVGATGTLLNRAEVLPDSVLQCLDLHNFVNRLHVPHPAKSDKSATRTWHFQGSQIHDFAWTADRTFLIGAAHWEDVTIYALARAENAKHWQDAAEIGARAVQFFSEKIGRYPYPQMTIADVDEGMEYPMIVMCGGESPSYNELFYHEVGHNWFYGLIANNETAYPALDEGFTTYITNLMLEKFENMQAYQAPGKSSWYRRWRQYDPDFWVISARVYLQLARRGLDEKVLTHSDHCLNDATYSMMAYEKTATTLRNLQGILGDAVFFKVLQTYFDRWKFRHPYPEDFQAVAEEVSGRRLDWFFEQWWHSTKTVDYAVKSVSNTKLPDGKYRARINLRRVGAIYQPIDLEMTLANGQKQYFTVPVDDGSKQVDSIQVLPAWYGWNDFQRNYTTSIVLPHKVTRVRLDPWRTLADINYLNNQSGLLPPLEVHLDNLYQDFTPISTYLLCWRPSFGYNLVDGLKTGLLFTGSYFGEDAHGDYVTRLGGWYGPLSGKFNHEFSLATPLRQLGKHTWLRLKHLFLEDRTAAKIGLTTTAGTLRLPLPILNLSLDFSHVELISDDYLWAPWEKGEVNTIEFTANYQTRCRSLLSQWEIQYKSTSFMSDFRFDKVTVQCREIFRPRSNWRLALRLYGGMTEGELPRQEQFYLTQASPREAFENPWYRSRGALPVQWTNQRQIQPAGGANLRGFLASPEAGKWAAAANVHAYFPNPWLPLARLLPGGKTLFARVEHYLFFDFGDVAATRSGFQFKHDAGLGLCWHIPYWPDRLPRLALRFDFPCYVSDPVPNEDRLQFRWVFGVDQLF